MTKEKVIISVDGVQNECSPPIKDKASKPQWGEQRGIPQRNIRESLIPRNIQVGTKRKIILRFQLENFAPTKFEIQIWVVNFGRGVEYSKI